jgi:hypothetical protein
LYQVTITTAAAPYATPARHLIVHLTPPYLQRPGPRHQPFGATLVRSRLAALNCTHGAYLGFRHFSFFLPLSAQVNTATAVNISNGSKELWLLLGLPTLLRGRGATLQPDSVDLSCFVIPSTFTLSWPSRGYLPFWAMGMDIIVSG